MPTTDRAARVLLTLLYALVLLPAHAAAVFVVRSGGAAPHPLPARATSDGAPAWRSAADPLPPTNNVSSALPQLVVAGDTGSARGTFDPSLAVAADGTVALSYSSVPGTAGVHTRVATLGPDGAWTMASTVNTVAPGTQLPCGSGTCTGTLVHEVSSLVHDAADADPRRRWKVFAHTYLVGEPGDKLLYQYGRITLYTAPSLHNASWVSEPLLGWNSDSPFSTSGVVQNLSSTHQLADCIAFTEPGAIVLNTSAADATTASTTIHLALGCVYVHGGKPNIRIVMLTSTDHAQSFSYGGVMVDGADAVSLGFPSPTLNAADLFVSAGQLYLIASPSGPVPYAGSGYDGCVVFAVTDETSGAVERRGSGSVPVVKQYLRPLDARFSGACTYHEDAPPELGYLFPMLFFDKTPQSPFHVVVSGVGAPDGAHE